MDRDHPSPTSILAGNSRLATNPDGSFTVEAQIHAFRAGLEKAVQLAKELTYSRNIHCFRPSRRVPQAVPGLRFDQQPEEESSVIPIAS